MACPKGQYFCNDEQMCKSIPAGHKVLKNGELVKEDLKKQIGAELKNLTTSPTFKDFKKDAFDIKDKLEKSANKFNQSDFKNQIGKIGTNLAGSVVDKLSKAAKEKINSFGEETQGGINIETYTDGIQFNEIETVNIIEPPKMKSSAHLTFIDDLKEETK